MHSVGYPVGDLWVESGGHLAANQCSGRYVTRLACALGGLARPFARSPVPPVPPDRPETCENHRKTTKIDRILPKSAGSSGPPSPVRPSLRARLKGAPEPKIRRDPSRALLDLICGPPLYPNPGGSTF